MRSCTRSLLVACAALAVVLPAARRAATEEADWRPTFFAAFEKGDESAALAALPAALRDAKLYDAKTEALPAAQRDVELYARLVEAFEAAKAPAAAARDDATVHATLGVLAWRKGEHETARRRLLLAALADPRSLVVHRYLARAYAALEEAAIEKAKDKDPATVLVELGAGSSDLHAQLAQDLGSALPEDAPAVDAQFRFDAGKVGEVKTERDTASGNARLMQRGKIAEAESGRWCVMLLAEDRRMLDEAWFDPVQTLWEDGVGPGGEMQGGPNRITTFDVDVELLATPESGRVIVLDPSGKKVAEAAVPAAAAK